MNHQQSKLTSPCAGHGRFVCTIWVEERAEKLVSGERDASA
jgi:hypothetical protein